jgi:hypothetical protein
LQNSGQSTRAVQLMVSEEECWWWQEEALLLSRNAQSAVSRVSLCRETSMMRRSGGEPPLTLA